MTRSTRWTLALLAVAAVLIAALAAQIGRDQPGTATEPAAQSPRAHRDADTPEALAGPRSPDGLAAAGSALIAGAATRR